jgi:hypothetical protein
MNENFFKRLKSIPKATKLAFKIKNMIDKGKEYDYILAVLLQEIPDSTEEQIKKILDPFWEQHKPDTSSEDNISNQLDNLLSQEKLKENMKNQTEKSRWAKIAGLPKSKTKQQLDENVVGVGAINPIFAVREPKDYELAFEHYLGEMYGSKKENVDGVSEGEEGVDESMFRQGMRGDTGLSNDSEMVKRIEGLANVIDLKTMKDMLRILTTEWEQEGFDREDIQDYITDFINKI